jgi:hypothetical protein
MQLVDFRGMGDLGCVFRFPRVPKELSRSGNALAIPNITPMAKTRFAFSGRRVPMIISGTTNAAGPPGRENAMRWPVNQVLSS